MLGFLLRRLIVALLVGVTVLTIAFALTRLSGDLAIAIAGANATQQDVELIRRAYGLDQPAIVVAFSATPALPRLTRSGMIQALASDYIRTARAKGLSSGSILIKHALRNAAIPVVAIATVQLGFMLGGSIVIETVFALHGVGFLAWESIGKNDFPVVQAVVLVLALIYVGLNLLAG